ncbi:hypothetical protein F5Y14DRAFT_412904 [Nemania sp. NC0429]|nr:hypothetical protein F5Y14DRAFT_412904 [Nemania sp. NC0429]
MRHLQGRYSEVQDQSLDTHQDRYEGEGFGYHSQYHYAPNPSDFQHAHESNTSSNDSERQYKPTALRWPFLLTLLLALLATLVVLSYAVTLLPVAGSRDEQSHLEVRGMYRHGILAYMPNTETIARGSVHGAKARENVEADTSAPARTTSSASSDGATETRIFSDYGRIGTNTVTISDPVTTSTTIRASGDSSDSSDTTSIAQTRDPSDYGRIGTQTVTVTDPITTSTTVKESGNPSDSSDTISIPQTRDPSDYGNIGTKTITDAPPDTTPTRDPNSTSIDISGPNSDNEGVGGETISKQSNNSKSRVDETLTHVTLGVVTITDENGSVTTSTETPTSISSFRISTLTNADGQSTGTQVLTVTIVPSITVETDSLGHPTATVVTYPIPPSVHTAVYSIDGGHYFIGVFLPTVVASILATAVRILDTNVKIFQPWHALTHERGISGRDSLCLETGGWSSLVMSLRSLAGGQVVVFLSTLLSLASALLIPFSAGAILLDLRGDGCEIGGTSASNCAYVLSASPNVSKATIGILALMSLATIFLVIIVGRWRLGVYTNPWSMCALSSLSTNLDVQRIVLAAVTGPNIKQARSQLKHQDFKLDYFRNAKGKPEYGLVALDRFNNMKLSSTYEDETIPLTTRLGDDEIPRRNRGSPFMLGILGRLSLLLMLLGVLTLVLYYALTGGDTAFERFIDSDSFGVQFLFTSLGVIICLFWSALFGAVAAMTPYQVLAERPREASRTILSAPPTNAFSGLWRAARTHRPFLGFVSLASILSESLGIFLGNVRFQVTQTLFVFQLCTWSAVGIMSIMVLVLSASFFMRWPDMPIEPSSIAGAMYYVCDSNVADRFEGLSTLNKQQRDRIVIDMALLYEFSEMMSATGGSKIGLKALNADGFIP